MGDPGTRPSAPQPLSPEAAKARLLAAAEAADPGIWIRRHPARAGMLALLAGLLLARLPAGRLAPFVAPLLARPSLVSLLLKALSDSHRRR